MAKKTSQLLYRTIISSDYSEWTHFLNSDKEKQQKSFQMIKSV